MKCLSSQRLFRSCNIVTHSSSIAIRIFLAFVRYLFLPGKRASVGRGSQLGSIHLSFLWGGKCFLEIERHYNDDGEEELLFDTKRNSRNTHFAILRFNSTSRTIVKIQFIIFIPQRYLNVNPFHFTVKCLRVSKHSYIGHVKDIFGSRNV